MGSGASRATTAADSGVPASGLIVSSSAATLNPGLGTGGDAQSPTDAQGPDGSKQRSRKSRHSDDHKHSSSSSASKSTSSMSSSSSGSSSKASSKSGTGGSTSSSGSLGTVRGSTGSTPSSSLSKSSSSTSSASSQSHAQSSTRSQSSSGGTAATGKSASSRGPANSNHIDDSQPENEGFVDNEELESIATESLRQTIRPRASQKGNFKYDLRTLSLVSRDELAVEDVGDTPRSSDSRSSSGSGGNNYGNGDVPPPGNVPPSGMSNYGNVPPRIGLIGRRVSVTTLGGGGGGGGSGGVSSSAGSAQSGHGAQMSPQSQSPTSASSSAASSPTSALSSPKSNVGSSSNRFGVIVVNPNNNNNNNNNNGNGNINAGNGSNHINPNNYGASGPTGQPSTPAPPQSAGGGANKINWAPAEVVGQGAFGKVYLGMNLDTGELMAVKHIEFVLNETLEYQLEQLKQEISVMKKLHHENIVQYKGAERVGNALNIFLEYCPGGSLTTALKRFGAFGEKVLKVYVPQMLRGLKYLHENKIIHRDIKGANLLLTADAKIKLADFGASKDIAGMATMGGDACHSLKGTPFWMAPEVIKQNAYGRSADIWSLGCTIIELATGKPPWSEAGSGMAALFRIADSTEYPTIPDYLSEDCKSFILQTLERDPSRRPTASDLLQHPWLRDVSSSSSNLMPASAQPPANPPNPPQSAAATSRFSAPTVDAVSSPTISRCPSPARPAFSFEVDSLQGGGGPATSPHASNSSSGGPGNSGTSSAFAAAAAHSVNPLTHTQTLQKPSALNPSGSANSVTTPTGSSPNSGSNTNSARGASSQSQAAIGLPGGGAYMTTSYAVSQMSSGSRTIQTLPQPGSPATPHSPSHPVVPPSGAPLTSFHAPAPSPPSRSVSPKLSPHRSGGVHSSGPGSHYEESSASHHNEGFSGNSNPGGSPSGGGGSFVMVNPAPSRTGSGSAGGGGAGGGNSSAQVRLPGSLLRQSTDNELDIRVFVEQKVRNDAFRLLTPALRNQFLRVRSGSGGGGGAGGGAGVPFSGGGGGGPSTSNLPPSGAETLSERNVQTIMDLERFAGPGSGAATLPAGFAGLGPGAAGYGHPLPPPAQNIGGFVGPSSSHTDDGTFLSDIGGGSSAGGGNMNNNLSAGNNMNGNNMGNGSSVFVGSRLRSGSSTKPVVVTVRGPGTPPNSGGSASGNSPGSAGSGGAGADDYSLMGPSPQQRLASPSYGGRSPSPSPSSTSMSMSMPRDWSSSPKVSPSSRRTFAVPANNGGGGASSGALGQASGTGAVLQPPMSPSMDPYSHSGQHHASQSQHHLLHPNSGRRGVGSGSQPNDVMMISDEDADVSAPESMMDSTRPTVSRRNIMQQPRR